MIKDIIIVALLVQIGIDILSAKVVGRRLNQIEDRFFRKHEADIRHRDRETQARSEQIRTLKGRVHNLDRKIHQCPSYSEVIVMVHRLENKNRV